MQIINDDEKEVYDGDIGTAITLDEDRLLAIGENERQVVYGFGELDSVVLVYAMTIHKAQGSEYPVVLVRTYTKHSTVLARRPIYTGITRGKRFLVVVIGQKRSLWIAVNGKADRPATVVETCRVAWE